MQLSISVEDGETSCADKTEVTQAHTLMYYKDRPTQHKLQKHNRWSEEDIMSFLQQRKGRHQFPERNISHRQQIIWVNNVILSTNKNEGTNSAVLHPHIAGNYGKMITKRLAGQSCIENGRLVLECLEIDLIIE